LRYRRIPANEVRFEPGGLTIDVRQSAGPVVYPLDAPLDVTHVHARGRVRGVLAVLPERQGDEGADDYALRVGLVEAGNRTLGFVERMVAPGWIKRLYRLAPKGRGVAGVRFFNVATGDARLGRTRRHPLSDLITETVAAATDGEGRFDLDVRLPAPVRTLAIWLAADGDDTDSTFAVTIDTLELDGEPASP
ncbi:MAG: hypothetical protein AB7N90_10280, partial [Vicinamibacterales bacterium]